MPTKLKPLCLAASLLLSAPAGAVDLVGVHDLALQNDPRLRAAEFRREATGENKAIARANMLPQLGASGSWTRGDSETEIADGLFRSESAFSAADEDLIVAAGTVKRAGLVGSTSRDQDWAWLSTWGPVERAGGGHG